MVRREENKSLTRVDGEEKVTGEDLILLQLSMKFSGLDIEMFTGHWVFGRVLAEDDGLVAGGYHCEVNLCRCCCKEGEKEEEGRERVEFGEVREVCFDDVVKKNWRQSDSFYIFDLTHCKQGGNNNMTNGSLS